MPKEASKCKEEPSKISKEPESIAEELQGLISASKAAPSGSDLDLENMDSDDCLELTAFLQECTSAKEEPEVNDS